MTGSFYASSSASNLPFMALADVDGSQPRPELHVSATALDFPLKFGQPSPTQDVIIANVGTTDVLHWEAEVTAGSPWLRLSQMNGVTPGTLVVSVDHNAILAGVYTGKIRITATGPVPVAGSPQGITVNLSVWRLTFLPLVRR